MKLKTKLDKHIEDNAKRRNAIIEKVKLKTNQSEIIKQALSTSNLHRGPAKKIVFNDDESDDVENGVINENKTNGKIRNSNTSKKPALFDGDSSEDETFNIKEKNQFSGKKGFELLKLQGSYGNDERFKIDERFIEENDKNDSENLLIEESNGIDDKSRALEILNDILGKSSLPKKSKKRTFEMIRYDESNKEHEKYEVKQNKEENDEWNVKKEKKKKRKKWENSSGENKPQVVVSKEKFYEVSKDIKNSFGSDRKSESQGFSLLQTYSQNDGKRYEASEEEKTDNEIEEEEEINEEKAEDLEKPSSKSKSNDKHDSEKKSTETGSGEKASAVLGSQSHVTIAKGIWKESFFFESDDPRLQEGVEFMNKKNSAESNAVAENYDVTRKKLREIIRLHNKKQLAKKDPFKKKIGGASQKVSADSKPKHWQKSDGTFNKRKPFKVKKRGKF